MIKCPECSVYALQSNPHGKGIQCSNCGYTPVEMETFDYIHRPRSKMEREGSVRWVEASTFHLVDEADRDLSRCGMVRVGEDGYVHVDRDFKLLLSLTCSNCLNRVVVTTKK